MNLEELKKIDDRAETLEYHFGNLRKAQSNLQGLRTGPHATIEAVLDMFRNWCFGAGSIAKEEFFAVLTEQMSSAMHIAELRLEAKARAASVESELLRAQITAFFGEDKPAVEVSA